jgi:hypothetical protein
MVASLGDDKAVLESMVEDIRSQVLEEIVAVWVS